MNHRAYSPQQPPAGVLSAGELSGDVAGGQSLGRPVILGASAKPGSRSPNVGAALPHHPLTVGRAAG